MSFRNFNPTVEVSLILGNIIIILHFPSAFLVLNHIQPPFYHKTITMGSYTVTCIHIYFKLYTVLSRPFFWHSLYYNTCILKSAKKKYKYVEIYNPLCMYVAFKWSKNHMIVQEIYTMFMLWFNFVLCLILFPFLLISESYISKPQNKGK